MLYEHLPLSRLMDIPKHISIDCVEAASLSSCNELRPYLNHSKKTTCSCNINLDHNHM